MIKIQALEHYVQNINIVGHEIRVDHFQDSNRIMLLRLVSALEQSVLDLCESVLCHDILRIQRYSVFILSVGIFKLSKSVLRSGKLKRSFRFQCVVVRCTQGSFRETQCFAVRFPFDRTCV